MGKDCNDHLLHGGHFGGGLNEDAAAQQSKDAIIYVTVREREREREGGRGRERRFNSRRRWKMEEQRKLAALSAKIR